jgi:hypothetical protein
MCEAGSVSLPVPVTPATVVRTGASPVALGAGGIGALVALATGAGIGGIVLVALLGWLVAGGILLAVRRGAPPKARIDPFAIGEPWRHFVKGALTARNRFDEARRTTRPGPLRDRLDDLRRSIDSGVEECWRVAQQAQVVSDARKRLDAPALRRRLSSLEESGNEPAASAVRAQLASAERLDTVIADTTQRLETLEARLTEAVARAIEVAALAGHDDDLVTLGSDVDTVVEELEALRLALAETSGPPREV